MDVKSIGYQTDIMLASFDGEVIYRPHYVVVRTPTSPAFWWGNFVLFDRPPCEGDADKWEAIFATEVGYLPGINHVNIAWEASDGMADAVEPFLARGYVLTRNVFLITTVKIMQDQLPPGIEVRPISGDHEWELALHNQYRCLEGANDTAAFREFQADQMARYRKMTNSGFGYWMGAFFDGRMVGGMGIFANRGLARCQAVGVDPDFRRRGVAEAMLRSACVLAQESLTAKTIVIMTGEDHPARRIYERVGFISVEHAASLARTKHVKRAGEIGPSASS